MSVCGFGVNDQLLMNNWTEHTDVENSCSGAHYAPQNDIAVPL